MSVREVALEAYREAVPALAASVVGGLFAGVVLGGMRGELEAVKGLLVLVPALLATRGNVFGSLGARLSTGLHQGLLEPYVDLSNDRLRGAIAAALSNGIFVSLFAATAVFVVLNLLSAPVAPLPTLLAIAVLAGLFSGIALTVAVVGVVFLGFRRGHNPDTLVGPLVTTTGDVFGVAFLLLAVRIVLGLGGG
ncbi:magnesium transporter [Haloarchaeobius sp. HME9146]|uniref:magnesium transporter n=1 Tax=Haloarchaeobius sp. HME9146 TaxID=2978732 RepID=UPI0021C17025|nr:magnesium transporter [Haloarchaeobius sp. HME9146]MCT9094957.1 magnesium transporter [Haloarchaeobius sp. HME9146]